MLHHNIQAEQLGGETQATGVSAITVSRCCYGNILYTVDMLKGENIDNLLESILAQAELLDLKADYSGPVGAVVVESKMTRGLG